MNGAFRFAGHQFDIEPGGKWRIPVAAVASLLGGLFASGRAEATSCLIAPSTLAESYANALEVVVAQVDGCADGALPTNGHCPDYRYHFNILEILKDSVPARDFSGTYQGGDPERCGTVLNPGESYLLFVSGAGSFDRDASGALKGKVPRTRQLQQSLEILRDYRDETIDDLAGPWSFVDNGLSCDLRHEVADQEISFSYQHSVELAKHGFAKRGLNIEYDEDGYATHFNAFPIDSGIGPDVEIAFEGPEIRPSTLLFTARFDQLAKTFRDSATVQVGDQSWDLSSHVATVRANGRDLAEPFVTDIAWGEDAHEILQAMLEPRDVIVLKRRAGTDIGPTPPPGDDLHVSIETRTTQISAEASKFLACVDGSVRRRPPDGL